MTHITVIRLLMVGFVLSGVVFPACGDREEVGQTFPATNPDPPRIARVGFLAEDDPDPVLSAGRQFIEGMAELGWVENQNYVIEYRFTGSRPDLAYEMAVELAELPVDVLVTVGTVRAQAAQAATSRVPIVMANVGDPVASGVVTSLSRPGGNITGMSQLAPGLAATRLELLRETAPHIGRVAVLWNPNNSGSAIGLEETEAAARSMGIEILAVPVPTPGELPDALRVVSEWHPDALVPLGDQLFFARRQQLVEFTRDLAIPSVHDLIPYVREGALLFYGPYLPDLYRRASTHVDKILRGASPGDLPVEQPVSFLLGVNLRTAAELGITVPPSVLNRATNILE